MQSVRCVLGVVFAAQLLAMNYALLGGIAVVCMCVTGPIIWTIRLLHCGIVVSSIMHWILPLSRRGYINVQRDSEYAKRCVVKLCVMHDTSRAVCTGNAAHLGSR